MFVPNNTSNFNDVSIIFVKKQNLADIYGTHITFRALIPYLSTL